MTSYCERTRTRVIDSTGDLYTMEEVEPGLYAYLYIKKENELDHTPVHVMAPQADLPPGVTLQCDVCKTRLRPGQPHSALKPYPHQTLLAMGIAVAR